MECDLIVGGWGASGLPGEMQIELWRLNGRLQLRCIDQAQRPTQKRPFTRRLYVGTLRRQLDGPQLNGEPDVLVLHGNRKGLGLIVRQHKDGPIRASRDTLW